LWPLPEPIEELNEKVVDAAKKLQQQLSEVPKLKFPSQISKPEISNLS
jgi:hypothetical protein